MAGWLEPLPPHHHAAAAVTAAREPPPLPAGLRAADWLSQHTLAKYGLGHGVVFVERSPGSPTLSLQLAEERRETEWPRSPDGGSKHLDGPSAARLDCPAEFRAARQEDCREAAEPTVVQEADEEHHACRYDTVLDYDTVVQEADEEHHSHHHHDEDTVAGLLDRLGWAGASLVREADAARLGASLNADLDVSSLNLDGVRFSPVSFAALCRQLTAGSLPKLPALSLARAGSSIGEAGALALAEASCRGAFGGLEALVLTNCGLQDAGTSAFCKACTSESFPRMRKLVLEQNQIGDAGAKAIAEAIIQADFPRLYTLDLTDNVIGDAGAKALSRVANKRDLQTLELDGNQIGNKGATAFAKANMGSAHLHDLSLRRNPIGLRGKLLLKSSVILNVRL